ncbi:MAG TPA: hypothetical protein VH590_12615 [Ktedonobacterales bacterium]|jgi:general stress protein YciG
MAGTEEERFNEMYSEPGKQDDEARKEGLGPEGYSELGKMGGEEVEEVEEVKEGYSPEFYSELGKQSGEKVREERGPEFYRDIGRESGEARREPTEEE